MDILDEAEQTLNAGRVKDEEGRFDEAFALYQHGLEKLMEKLKRSFIILSLSLKFEIQTITNP